jgi:hypothetical protein
MDWRDRVLDRIADDYERSGEQAKADRLRHFLRDAREIASWNGDLDTPGEQPRLEQWVTERLDELAHGRPVTTIGVYYRTLLALTCEFRLISDDDDAPHDAPGWLPVVERLETMLFEPQFVNDDGKSIRLARRHLTDDQRNEVIATDRGAIRPPHLMALYLLWLACRPHDEALRDFRTQLERYEPKAGPVPLTAPPTSAS